MSEVVSSNVINQYLFDSITSEIDSGEPRELAPEHYGKIKKILNLKYKSKYSNFGLEQQKHRDGMSNDFKINYSIFEPENIPDNIEISTIFFIHGVIDNSTGFFPLGNMLGVFYRLVFIDLLGFGQSSHPHGFPWSFEIHSNINIKLMESVVKIHRWNKKIFVIGHDWGGGVVTVIATKKTFLFGAILINTIAINNYWVTEIGSLVALAKLDFKSEDDPEKVSNMFKISATSFVGGYTQLKKSMHEKSSRDLNQNTLQSFENDYIESKAYSDPKKNPLNTKVNYWNVRCLAEHAANLLGNGQLLPKSNLNPNGLDFVKLNIHMMILHSDKDDMMPQQNVPKLKWMIEKVIQYQRSQNKHDKLSIRTGYIYDAGHFSTSDQPAQITHQIIDFIDNVIGPHHKAIDYLGMGILQRGDFEHMKEQFKKFKINNIP